MAPGIENDALSKTIPPLLHHKKRTAQAWELAVVQKIIVQHGGHVEARNRPEGGACLYSYATTVRRRGRKR